MFGGRPGRSCYITAVSGLLLVHKGRDSGARFKLGFVYILYSCVEVHVGYLIGCNALLKMYKRISISMHDTKQVEKSFEFDDSDSHMHKVKCYYCIESISCSQTWEISRLVRTSDLQVP